MGKEEREDELAAEFMEFAAEYPQSALALITGLFVGLLEYSVKEQGGDETREIKIDGCGKRDIIVCAVPNAELCGGPSGPSERAPGYASAPKMEE